MARDNDKNSGGTEFYIALGEHRYLDLNISSFGRVISGIEHIQRLDRKPNTNSADTLYNPIISFAVASDLSSSPAHTIQVLKTNSDGFKQYLKARRNRTEAWFHYQANYLDVCSVSVPVRISEE
jgi:peptidylprolyl isomerase